MSHMPWWSGDSAGACAPETRSMEDNALAVDDTVGSREELDRRGMGAVAADCVTGASGGLASTRVFRSGIRLLRKRGFVTPKSVGMSASCR